MLAVSAVALLGAGSTMAIRRIQARTDEPGSALHRMILAVCGMNLALLLWQIATQGPVAALASSFNCTILLATLLVTAAFLADRGKLPRGMEILILPVATVLQVAAFAAVLRQPPVPSTAHWFVVHQLSMIVGGAFFMCGGLAGGAYLALNHILNRKTASPLVGRLAPLESWEKSGRSFISIGFALFTFGILTGICEAVQLDQAVRPNWLTDVVILICFALWGAYACGLLATWCVPSFRGRRSAAMALGSGTVLLVIFLAIDVLSTIHS